jgi:hypothetical protein
VLDCIAADDEVWSYVNGHIHKVMLCKFHVFEFSEVLNVASYKLGNNVISNIFGGVEAFNERLPIHIWIRKFTSSMQTFSKFITPFGHETASIRPDLTWSQSPWMHHELSNRAPVFVFLEPRFDFR